METIHFTISFKKSKAELVKCGENKQKSLHLCIYLRSVERKKKKLYLSNKKCIINRTYSMIFVRF